MEHKFKRYFYSKLKETVEEKKFAVLTGPRKCGKTVALEQLHEEYPSSEYINFRDYEGNIDKIYEIYEKIENSILNHDNSIYLFDEYTHAEKPEAEMNKIALAFSKIENNNVTIIFTGSDSTSLENWATRTFSSQIKIIETNFINYAEWLDYKMINTVSEETYKQFVLEVSDFYHFEDMKTYLKSCLDETITSNAHIDRYNFLTDIDNVTEDSLLNLCYSTLYSLHNSMTVQKFYQKDRLHRDLGHLYTKEKKKIGNDEFYGRIDKFYQERSYAIRNYDYDEIRQSLVYLSNCGLITFTPFSDDGKNIPNILNDLYKGKGNKENLFKTFNITINYPMFYIAIVKDILKDDMPNDIPDTLLGSIIECHLRGLLSTTGCYEHREVEVTDNKTKMYEVDIVNPMKKIGIEISKANKELKKVNLNRLPDDYEKILLTNNVTTELENMNMFTYYDFIYAASYAHAIDEEFMFSNDKWLSGKGDWQI